MVETNSLEGAIKIIIYNPNSFGGNHEYARALCRTYRAHQYVSSTVLLMPSNSPADDKDTIRLLMPDVSPCTNNLLKKLYFIYRSFLNPFRLYRFLKKSSKSAVIFNDFDQVTSFFWSRLFNSLKKKHLFAVILHDPDRDKYSPFPWLSVSSMQFVMNLMDVAFYHGHLPVKPYYKNECLKVEVPHGIFDPVAADCDFKKSLQEKVKEPVLLGVLGNIREEKNYDLILDAMPGLPGCQLLVAGAKANSGVPVHSYRQKIIDLGLEDKVIWIERFLEEGELHAAIETCDIIIMYYSKSFQSQSGILNMIAPYRKKLLVADTPSALQKVVDRFELGLLVLPDDERKFIEGVKLLIGKDADEFNHGWRAYAREASWEAHVDIAMTSFKKMMPSS